MRNIQTYVSLFLFVWAMFSCTDENMLGGQKGDLRVIGSIEPSSRTQYEVEEDRVTVSWATDDVIGLFTNEQTELLQYKASSEGKQVIFAPVSTRLNKEEGKDVYAFYPYEKTVVSYPKLELPSLNQKYTNGLPPADCDLMYAKGKIMGEQLVLDFKHIFSFIKLNIKSELLKGTYGLFVKSMKPIMYVDNIVGITPYFDFEEENISTEKSNEIWYSIPSNIIEKQDIITCYIAVLPTTEDNYITFYTYDNKGAGDCILEKKAPKDGFKAGYVYDLTLTEVDYDPNKIEHEEREALVAFYNATGGSQWKNNSNWCSDKPLSEWYGIEMEYNRVVRINLSNNNLTGNIPAEIQRLMHLNILNLNDNNLSGELTDSISYLNNLSYLYLSNNRFEGTLPKSFSKLMDNLQRLELGFNNFSGRLPESVINHPNWKNLWVGCISGGFDISGVKLPAPDFVIQDIDGNIISSDVEYTRNKLTAFVHWSYTCPFSQEYIKNYLIPLYESYKSRGFEVIGFCLDSKEDIQKYVDEYQIKWRNFEMQTIRGFQIPGFFTRLTPTIFVVDQNKEVIFQSLTQDRNNLTNLLSERLGDIELYTSTDYSRDGEVQILQKATKGKGINLIFMGEAFVDKDMGDNGLYEQVMQKAVDQYFAYEPLKSFRDRFNVYSVKVISPNAEFYPNALHRINEDNAVCFEYARKIPGLEDAPYQMISVIYNKGCTGRSYTSMYYGDRSYVSYMMEGVSDVLNHEACGHGLGRLMDEYVEPGNENEILPDFEREEMDNEWNLYNWGANVDWRSTPKEVKWAHFLEDTRYAGENLGLYEGSYLYGKGAYRPTENSMMRFNDSPFNAPSRERIYQVIMELSEGNGWVYDYDDFVAYDAINRNYVTSRALSSPTSESVRENWKKRHRAPVIMKGNWKEAR